MKNEVDESDGSIALYRRTWRCSTISLDHLETLIALFRAHRTRAGKAVNLDNSEGARYPRSDDAARAAHLYDRRDGRPDRDPTCASNLPSPSGSARGAWRPIPVTLQVPSRFYLTLAAAIGAASGGAFRSGGEPPGDPGFSGPQASLRAGEAGRIAVIDDFGHNPDKIAATLDTRCTPLTAGCCYCSSRTAMVPFR